ncbi:MAG: leucine-rich repeat protein [Oscillospiraceae bacterium]|nr:leucine-rich repeat protein [Oscillospiraceae bacterium]
MEAKRLISGIISMVIVITMLCSCLSVEVFATEGESVSTEFSLTEDPFQSSLDDFATLTDNVQTVTVEYSPDLLYAGFAEYTTVEQAALAVRESLKNHVPDFFVYIASDCDDYKQVYLDLLYIAETHTGNPIEGDYLVWQTGDMELYIYLTKFEGVNYYKMRFVVPYYTTLEQEMQLTAEINNVLSSLNLYNATDYQKVKGIYDYICQNVTYDYANASDYYYGLKHSAYAALINKTAVCQGYALLFYRLALELGIDARFVSGVANGGAHGWNIVELGGKYYNLDCTWDAGRNYRYFLKSDANFADHVRHEQYSADRFVSRHPMSSSDYYEAEFTIIDGTLVSYNGIGGDVVIPEGVIEIGEGAFRNASNITSITVPESVLIIADSAFDCNMASITIKSADTYIADSFTTIGAGAVINGHEGSTAQNYAFRYSRVFSEITELRGDLDGNGIVDNNDAIYLLYASVFGVEEYPINQDCDYNNNGIIDGDDATYLLYHTLFGAESYPLN